MLSNTDKLNQQIVKTPKYLFLFCILTAELIPFLIRLPSVPMRGWEWFTDYLMGGSGLFLIAGFNLIPGVVLYVLGKLSKRTPIAFWFALISCLGYFLYAHGTVNLRACSTAVIALFFIPIYSACAVVIGWSIGLVAHFVFRIEKWRMWLIWILGIATIILGVGNAMYESTAIIKRESKFPVVKVNELPFLKRTILPEQSIGRVEVLTLGNFDSEQGNEIAVLGDEEIALINPINYIIKSKFDFAFEERNEGVHMYPYLVPDGKGGLLVASSDGLSDNHGRLLWALKISGFTRLVPIFIPGQETIFLSYDAWNHIDCHDKNGKVLWSIKLDVSDVGNYITSEGEQLPFTLVSNNKSNEFKIFSLDGKLVKTINLPSWASEVEGIGWPTRGHLLVGYGSRIGIIDSNGNQVFNYDIKDTSFNPYHGPEGTAVRFNTAEELYLAVMCHGSSGYPRSVLLIFNPKGQLVWEEELNELFSILSIPKTGGKGEILLVGGIDGIIEYSLPETSIDEN